MSLSEARDNGCVVQEPRSPRAPESPASRRASYDAWRWSLFAALASIAAGLADLVTNAAAINDVAKNLLAPAAAAGAVLAVAAFTARLLIHWRLGYWKRPREAANGTRLTPQLRRLAHSLTETQRGLRSGELSVRRRPGRSLPDSDANNAGEGRS